MNQLFGKFLLGVFLRIPEIRQLIIESDALAIDASDSIHDCVTVRGLRVLLNEGIQETEAIIVNFKECKLVSKSVERSLLPNADILSKHSVSLN